MDHERERVLDEIREEFETEVRPLQSKLLENQKTTEDTKDQIRRIQMRFEALREDIVRDAEVVENRVKDEIGFEHMRNVDQLEQYTRQVELEGAELKNQVDDASRNAEFFRAKLEQEKKRLQK